jgi:hypothetical protein
MGIDPFSGVTFTVAPNPEPEDVETSYDDGAVITRSVVRLTAATVNTCGVDALPTGMLPKSKGPPVTNIVGVVYAVGAKSTPRNAVFVGDLASVSAKLPDPVSVTLIKKLL